MNESRRQDFERDIDHVRGLHEGLVRGAGGTPGGTWLFFLGLVLAGAGLWFFLGNVHVVTGDTGFFSRQLSRGMFGGERQAASTGIVFAPIFIGLVMLFYDSRMKWGWALFYVGLAIIVIEILTRINFIMRMPTSNLLLMLGMVAARIGMMLRSFRDGTYDGPPPSGGNGPPPVR